MRHYPRTAIASSLLAALLMSSCSSNPPEEISVDTGLLAQKHRTIEDVRSAVTSQEETAESVASDYLAVISEKDEQLNAITSINPEALDQARALDERIEAGEEVGQLAGVPFLVKDNFDVAGFPTTAGSIALTGNYPTETSPAVQRLLDEDAILLGKTNMSEFAASYGRLGYSSAGGLTLNPANTARDASGSSSGSAAAVAAGMSIFALGSDTGGSVRGPASVTGLVGVRPTEGLLPRTGVVPLALSFDTIGAMTANIEDQRTVLEVLAGPDDGDPASAALPAAYSVAGSDHTGLRVGVVEAFMGGNAEVDAAVETSVEALKTDGVEVERLQVADDFSTLWADVLGPVGDAEFASQLDDYLASSPVGVPKTLDQLIAFYDSPGPSEAVTAINPSRLDGMRTALDAEDKLDSAEVRAIREDVMPAMRDQVLALLEDNDLDALVFPTMSCVATPRWDVPDDSYHCASDDPYTASYLGSATGLPEATVPVGTDEQGLPIGLSFLGRPYSEGLLLDFGSLLEN